LQSAKTLKKESAFILHGGDIAYNLDDNNSQLGDEYMRSIQGFAAYTPYITSAGNHELDSDFSEFGNQATFDNYDHRFATLGIPATASGSSQLHYYSWDYGLIHFVSYDTDAWIYYTDQKYLHDLMQPQWDWLNNDLKNVNRSKTPWIIAFPHHSMYCTKASDQTGQDNALEECVADTDIVRNGYLGKFPMEQLIMEAGVDIMIIGHTHHYERTYPVYKDKVIQQNYDNPRGPVHVLTGLPVINGIDYFWNSPPDWCAFQEKSYTTGINYITLYNETTINFKFLANNGTTLDDFTIVQTKHGPFL